METRQVILEGASLKALMDIATELREQRYTMRETNCHLMETNLQLGILVEVIKLASGKVF